MLGGNCWPRRTVKGIGPGVRAVVVLIKPFGNVGQTFARVTGTEHYKRRR